MLRSLFTPPPSSPPPDDAPPFVDDDGVPTGVDEAPYHDEEVQNTNQSYPKRQTSNDESLLPETLFNMPRYNPNTGSTYEGKFQNPMKDADYQGMLLGQALPGFVLAGFGLLLAIVSVLLDGCSVHHEVFWYVLRFLQQRVQTETVHNEAAANDEISHLFLFDHELVWIWCHSFAISRVRILTFVDDCERFCV